MAELDFMIEQVQQKGWLSISSLYFDNSYVINIFNTRGYVAYSPSKNIFASYNCEDTTHSSQIEGKYVVMDNNHFGMQQNITIVGDVHLQHFDMAQYSHYRFYWDAQTELPYPKIPTEAEIMAMVKDEDTGLYDGADTVTRLSGKEVSTICMYPEDKIKYSGAVIENWQKFYTNHTKFKKMLSEAYGISDAV